jgi:hypothetical protein
VETLISFHSKHTHAKPRLFTCVSPTSVASDSSLAHPPVETAKPHHQPRWRYGTEAETSIPEPPSAQRRSYELLIHAAALFTRPVNTIACTSYSLIGSY